jgi:hypothetical protein
VKPLIKPSTKGKVASRVKRNSFSTSKARRVYQARSRGLRYCETISYGHSPCSHFPTLGFRVGDVTDDKNQQLANQISARLAKLQEVLCSVSGRVLRGCCDRNSGPHQDLRHLRDLAWQGRPVRIQFKTRRFRCLNPQCPRQIFAESLPGIAAPRARETDRVTQTLRLVGYLLGRDRVCWSDSG